MHTQIGLTREDVAGFEEAPDGSRILLADIAYLKLSIVNAIFCGSPTAGDGSWVLVDTGLPTSAETIAQTAERRFSARSRPEAIVLTHGHFDHSGSAETLAARWDVPVYAHPLEHPYLNGGASYPPADPWVGGGTFSLLSPLFPRKPIDLGDRLKSLPSDGSVPGIPEWSWIHTPGHAPGHISLWRERDRTLIAGDAVITTGQESAYEVLTQTPEMHGPPRYFTIDWLAAEASVTALARLEPERIISGHGPPLSGPNMRSALWKLSDNFQQVAVPREGKYVAKRATADDDSAYRSP
ncbi:MBL fold metallo-hydrolase [Rhizobium sullae]|uniref:MBL fold metallo-hydrolase n=1 Tax=Rhizobium sullae TaxID=50338 RepID=UPI000B3593D7|nr:MBL fold metallo-hydrolase [Rhizobium sullae]